MITVSGLNQYFGGSHILREVNLTVAPGKVSSLMGRNGVGKTTLLKVMMGLLPIRTGTLSFDGEVINKLGPEQRAIIGMGYVPQGRMIFPMLTVEENLKVALAGRKDKSRKIPDHIFDLFPVLPEMAHRRGGDLSGGQQQQLAIGRALVQDPKLLILDEPCEGIQPSVVQEIADTILRLNSELGITVLVVEQRLKFVRAIASDFHIMERGQMRAEGAIDQLNDDLVQEYLTV